MRGTGRVFLRGLLVWSTGVAVCLPLVLGKPVPFDLVFVLDVSPNMAEPSAFIREGARLAAHELTPDDRIALLSYSSSITRHLEFADSRGQFANAVWRATSRSIRKSAPRLLHDSIHAAIQMFPTTPNVHRRRAIAVVTNDADQGSSHEPTALIQDANRRSVAIWVFLVKDPQSVKPIGSRHNPYPDIANVVKEIHQLANETGGEVVLKEPNGYVLRQIIEDCRAKWSR